MTKNRLLSVCIPTFQRHERLAGIIDLLDDESLNLELCIVVDGSTDPTVSFLESKISPRIRYVYQENQGRFAALKRAVEMATSTYIMLFDDDDLPEVSGFRIVLDDLQSLGSSESDVAGFIYSMSDGDSRAVLGGEVPVTKSNFLKLRADQGVKLDRKEVVRSDLIKKAFESYPIQARRVPSSLYWFTLALEHDVIYRNVIVGRKYYLRGGLTSNIGRIKNSNPFPMLLLNKVKVYGYLKGRYVSKRYFAMSLASLGYYSFRFAIERLKNLIFTPN